MPGNMSGSGATAMTKPSLLPAWETDTAIKCGESLRLLLEEPRGGGEGKERRKKGEEKALSWSGEGGVVIETS